MDERVNFILSACSQKRVAHIGCADFPYTERRLREGRLLHGELLKVASDVVGVDVSADGLAILRREFPSRLFVTPDEFSALNFVPDIIVAGEVIEHVENPGQFLAFLTSVAGQATKLVLTTPNAYSIKGALRSVGGSEYCHPDHVVLFSEKTLTNMLRRYGWTVDLLDYYFANPASAFARSLRVFFSVLRSLTSRRIGDGIMLIARKSDRQ